MKRFYLIIIFSLIAGQALFAQILPLKITRITVSDALVYAFQEQDTVFAVSTEGRLIPVRISSRERFHKEAARDLGLKYIFDAAWDGRYLYLAAGRGLFRYDIRVKILRKIAAPPLSLTSFKQRCAAALYKNKILYFSKNGRKEFSFNTDRLNYTEIISDSLLCAAGANEFYLIHTLSKPHITRITVSALPFSPSIKDLIKKGKKYTFEYFHPRLAARMNTYLMCALGNPSPAQTRLGLINLKSDSLLKTITLTGEILNISPGGDRFLITTGFQAKDKDSTLYSVNYQYQPAGGLLDSFKTELTLGAFPLSREYYFYEMGWSGMRIFKKNFPHRYRQFGLPYRYYVSQYFFPVHSKNLPGKWLFFLSSTNISKLEHRVYQFVFAQNRIEECLAEMNKEIARAKTLNTYRHCQDGLLQVESAMQYAGFLAPDSLAKYGKIRQSLYEKYRLKKRIKTYLSHSLIYLVSLILLILLLIVYLRQRRHAETHRSIPSAETLHFLLGSAFFHKLVTLLEEIQSAITKGQFDKLEELQESVRSVKQFLFQKKVSFEFRQAPANWRSFYRRLRRYLYLLNFSMKFYLSIKRSPLFKNFISKSLGSLNRRILQTRSEFQQIIEKARLDVITHALLPAFNQVQQKHVLKHIAFKNTIKSEFPYRYFPDEILKFRSLFEAIMENAVESFSTKENGLTKTITVSAVSSLNQLTILIEDNGRGMPKEILNNIFVPGFSFGKQGSNHGYGLAGLKDFIAKYGAVHVESQLNKGTRFMIDLEFKSILGSAI